MYRRRTLSNDDGLGNLDISCPNDGTGSDCIEWDGRRHTCRIAELATQESLVEWIIILMRRLVILLQGPVSPLALNELLAFIKLAANVPRHDHDMVIARADGKINIHQVTGPHTCPFVADCVNSSDAVGVGDA